MGSCWDLRDSHWSLCVTSLTSAYLLLTYGLRLIVCWFILSCCCGLSEFPISCLLVKDFFWNWSDPTLGRFSQIHSLVRGYIPTFFSASINAVSYSFIKLLFENITIYFPPNVITTDLIHADLIWHYYYRRAVIKGCLISL